MTASPVEQATVTLRGKYTDSKGQPVKGNVVFKPRFPRSVDAADDLIVIGSSVTVALSDGAFEVVLPATDDPGLNPTGFTYKVIEDFKGGTTYDIELPMAEPEVDLSDKSPVASVNGVAIVRGPKGDVGPEGPGNTVHVLDDSESHWPDDYPTDANEGDVLIDMFYESVDKFVDGEWETQGSFAKPKPVDSLTWPSFSGNPNNAPDNYPQRAGSMMWIMDTGRVWVKDAWSGTWKPFGLVPVTGQVGDTLEWNGTAWVTVSPRVRFGTGNPNGAVAAPVGSRYTDTAATNGAIEWLKTSGTGNTGWQVVYGDTGNRSVPSIASTGFTATSSIWRRNGNTVTCNFILRADVAFTAGGQAMTIPAGFRPAMSLNMPPPYTGAGPMSLQVTGTAVLWSALAANDSRAYAWTYMTADPWPTTLPGTPA